MIFVLPFAAVAVGTAVIALEGRGRSRPATVREPASAAERAFRLRLGLLPAEELPAVGGIADRVRPAAPRSEAQVRAFGALKLASAGVGLGVAGLFFFPLLLAGVACQLPSILNEFEAAYLGLVRERRVKSQVLNAIFILVALAGGFFLPLILGGWFLVFVKWLVTKTEDNSKRGIIDLFGHQHNTVWTVIDGVEVEVPVDQVQAGCLIAIQAGQTISMDGVIIDGHASIDQRLLTGEAQPAEKGPGDSVLAATVVLAGRIRVRVERAGEATTAAQITRVLTNTSDFKEDLVSRAEAFNQHMAAPVLLLSAVSLPFVGLNRALSVLMATPGRRMTLYGPLSMLSHLHLAAREGILFKDGRSLERLHDIDTVVFDKTGTLTQEQPHVRAIHACHGFSEEAVLTLAATAETKQSHPIARAILAEACARGIDAPAIGEASYELGYGITLWQDGATILVGSRRFMTMNEVAVPPALETVHLSADASGDSMVWVARNYTLAGGIVLHPTLRREVRAVLDQLRKRGVRLYIFSGDQDAPARQLAATLGMDGYFAEVLPQDKAALVRKWQAQGRKICFVGDGINDSIALESADVSISLDGAATIAIDRAQIVLINGNLTQLPRVFTLADEFKANMRVNYYAASLPCVLIVGGALFLGWGLLFSVLLYQISVPVALYNTARPLLGEGPAERAS